MFQVVRLFLIFLLGAIATQLIEESPLGGLLMGAASVGLTIWMVADIMVAFRAIGFGP